MTYQEMKSGKRNLFHMLLVRLKSRLLKNLVCTNQHPPYLQQHRLVAISIRIKLLSAAFAPLTLLWIAFDALTLPAAIWHPIAALRMLSAIIFVLLALAHTGIPTRSSTLTKLGIMLMMPLLIYGSSQWLFVGAPLEGAAWFNKRLYDALPMIVFSAICIFPLVVTEALMFAGLIVFVLGAIHLSVIGTQLLDLISILWGFMLAVGVYLLACTTQLYYMMVLLRRANQDPLTGALTRRSGIEALELQFRIACDQDAPLSLVFLDIDDFKSINDGFGHEAGDKALKNAVLALFANFRQADLIIRWGGEEFLIVLINTPMAGADFSVNRLTQNWLGTRPDSRQLTASMGISERKIDGVDDLSRLIAIADERMYSAKALGKACYANERGIVKPEMSCPGVPIPCSM